MLNDSYYKICNLKNKSILDCEETGVDYWSNGKQVFYGKHNIPLENANVDSFYSVGNVFAFDDRHVYRKRELIRGASPEDFAVLNYAFSRTKSHVISRSGKVKLTLDSDIEVYDEGKWYQDEDFPKGYIRVDDAIYYEGHFSGKLVKLTNVNVEKFRSLKNGVYGMDDEKVYAFGKIIKGVQAQGFHLFTDTPLCAYGVCENNLYYQDEKVSNIDISAIKIPKAILESGSHIYILEGNGKYYLHENEVSEEIFKKWLPD